MPFESFVCFVCFGGRRYEVTYCEFYDICSPWGNEWRGKSSRAEDSTLVSGRFCGSVLYRPIGSRTRRVADLVSIGTGRVRTVDGGVDECAGHRFFGGHLDRQPPLCKLLKGGALLVDESWRGLAVVTSLRHRHRSSTGT